MKEWNEMSNEDKGEVRGCLGLLVMVIVFCFFLLRHNKEIEYIEKHGVWTICSFTNKKPALTGFKVYFQFQLNNHTCSGSVIMSDKEIKTGKRFYMMVDPNDLDRYRIYDAVPEWFKLDAPPEGWKKRPATKELQNMLWENDKKRTSENDVSDEVSQNQTNEIEEDAVKEDAPNDRNDERDRLNRIMFIFGISDCVLIIIFVLYRKKKIRYIEGHGVWTILTITQIKASESILHYKVSYTFQSNNQTCTGSCVLSKKKVKSGGNRFFMMVVPGEENKLRIYDAVPEWFKLEAPPKGWEKRPAESELRDMLQGI